MHGENTLTTNPQELIQELETNAYNVLFYAGHGLPGPDGGMLFMRQNTTLNGMELAKVLTRTGVKLAVFNACWGAQLAAIDRHAITNSSLAEVLIRQGVPAVLGMRDEITDEESHSFIQIFAQALRMRKPIDEAVAVARQQLLTLYKFNRQAWTLPVLYLHPHYHGELIKSFDEGITELPDTSIIGMGSIVPTAFCVVSHHRVELVRSNQELPVSVAHKIMILLSQNPLFLETTLKFRGAILSEDRLRYELITYKIYPHTAQPGFSVLIVGSRSTMRKSL